jgi:hypothetical protein
MKTFALSFARRVTPIPRTSTTLRALLSPSQKIADAKFNPGGAGNQDRPAPLFFNIAGNRGFYMSVTFGLATEKVVEIEGAPRIHYTCVESAHEFNVSNSNAGMILEAIGMDPQELCGELGNALGLRERCLAILDQIKRMPELDCGRAMGEYSGEILGIQCARIIDCGQREGYMQEKISMLANLAAGAMEKEAVISFS